MPEGPLGFPRLTTLGPLVKPDSIEPAYDLPEDVYPFSMMDDYTPDTAHMVEMNIREWLDVHPDAVRSKQVSETNWHYHKMPVEKVITGNEFADSLNSFMVDLEEKYGDEMYQFENPEGVPIEDTAGGMIISPSVEKEVRNLTKGEQSILTEDELTSIAMSYQIYKDEGDMRILNEVIEKISSDLARVKEITEGIRSSGEYWPPAVEKDAEDWRMGFGTIDGSHRVVAHNTLIGRDESILVWEWTNQEEFMV